MDQPGKVANPTRGQLDRKNIIPLSSCVPESLVSRDGFSRSVPRQPAHLHTQAESGAYLRDSSRVPLINTICMSSVGERVCQTFLFCSLLLLHQTTTRTDPSLLYVWSSHSLDQPGEVTNPARGQLNRLIDIFLSPFAPEN